MPRPKRTKVAPSAPAPRVQKSTNSTAAKTASSQLKVALKDPYDISDSEKESTRDRRNKQRDNGEGKGKMRVSSDIMARDPEIQNSTISHAKMPMSHLASEPEDGNSNELNLDTSLSSPSIEVSRRERRPSVLESSMLAIGNFRRRARQPSILGRGAGRHRSSSVESNLADDNGLMSVGRKNTSALNVGNLKRRQRQPSITGRDVVATSSMALDMGGTPANVGSALKIGAFKRRAREPSILRTAQKPQQPRPNYDDDDEDEDDFNPDDESTPLNLSKTRNMNMSSNLSTSNSRKRKLSTAQVSQPSSPLPSSRVVEEEDNASLPRPPDDEEDQSGAGSERDLSVMPSIETRSITPEPLSETMAPPQSSSPEPPSPDLPSRARRAPSRGRPGLRGRTPQPRTQESPISSPPSLTHSPNRPSMISTKHNAKRAQPPASTLSTAQLQNLLPRRRRRPARDVFDIASSEEELDVSGLASDDDELSHLHIRTRSRRQTSVRSRTPATIRKPAKHKSGPQPITKRTYGSGINPTSDKENEGEPLEADVNDSLGPMPDEDESPEDSQELEERVGRELKQAAKKFKEVDEWELEFEDVTASSSSPKDAR